LKVNNSSARFYILARTILFELWINVVFGYYHAEPIKLPCVHSFILVTFWYRRG